MNKIESANGGLGYEIPTPIKGCPSCQGTGGVYSCPIHSPNLYVREVPKPFVELYLRCPWCGKDMQLDGYKLTKEGG